MYGRAPFAPHLHQGGLYQKKDHHVSMPDDPHRSADLLPITEVERQTGIRQATPRMWEKRYGFPQPLRDRHGDRVYPSSQVERLHAVRRLIDQGVRPGKIFSGAAEENILAGTLQVKCRIVHCSH